MRSLQASSWCAGPDWKSFVLTQLLVLLPIGLFFGWVIVDMDDDELPPVVVISLAILCAFTFIALVLTGLKNPGVIKRHTPRPAPELYDSSVSSVCACAAAAALRMRASSFTSFLHTPITIKPLT